MCMLIVAYLCMYDKCTMYVGRVYMSMLIDAYSCMYNTCISMYVP
jgi:hypothetical protein